MHLVQIHLPTSMKKSRLFEVGRRGTLHISRMLDLFGSSRGWPLPNLLSCRAIHGISFVIVTIPTRHWDASMSTLPNFAHFAKMKQIHRTYFFQNSWSLNCYLVVLELALLSILPPILCRFLFLAAWCELSVVLEVSSSKLMFGSEPSFNDGQDVDKRFLLLVLDTFRLAWAFDIRISWMRSWMRANWSKLSSEIRNNGFWFIKNFQTASHQCYLFSWKVSFKLTLALDFAICAKYLFTSDNIF